MRTKSIAGRAPVLTVADLLAFPKPGTEILRHAAAWGCGAEGCVNGRRIR